MPPQQFTGQRLDTTGLYYYGARYYDPTIGRFISPDAISPHLTNPQSLNRYTYCLNNPLKYNDPSGNYTVTDAGNGMYWLDEGNTSWLCADSYSLGDHIRALFGIQPLGGSSSSSSSSSPSLPATQQPITTKPPTSGSPNIPDSSNNSTIIGNPGSVIGGYNNSGNVEGTRITINQKSVNHIFQEGHNITDTTANRLALEDTANNPDNYVGTSKWGANFYTSLNDNLKQTWCQVWKGQITDGGINLIPRVWDPTLGELVVPSSENVIEPDIDFFDNFLP